MTIALATLWPWRWRGGWSMLQRMTFIVDADTGSWGDTGPPAFGALLQMRWVPDVPDTGADLQIALLPRAGDTGDGWVIYEEADALGEQFTKAPTQPTHGGNGVAAGSDTGMQPGVPIFAAGDRLRVKVMPGGDQVRGRLYLWTAR